MARPNRRLELLAEENGTDEYVAKVIFKDA